MRVSKLWALWVPEKVPRTEAPRVERSRDMARPMPLVAPLAQLSLGRLSWVDVLIN